MKNIAIIGSGSWGTALGIYLAQNGNKVKIWSFSEEEKKLINDEKKCMFLPKARIPNGIECSLDFKEVEKYTKLFSKLSILKSSLFLKESLSLFSVDSVSLLICLR